MLSHSLHNHITANRGMHVGHFLVKYYIIITLARRGDKLELTGTAVLTQMTSVGTSRGPLGSFEGLVNKDL